MEPQAQQQRLASQSYQTKGTIAEIAEQLDKALTKEGLKQQPATQSLPNTPQ
ncbi:MAG: hypothetical protein R3C11_28750 [Planctomycetaceae bacterium]